MPDVNDMDLVRDYARRNSESAFAELVQRHIALVYSAAFRHTGNSAHAEEITQAVFVILARKAASLRENTILEGWLYETTRLTALSFLRGERRRQFREQEAYMQSNLQENHDGAAWNQLAPLLDEALSRLGKKDRDAVMLRFFKEKSLNEVATTMQTSEAAAQRRVHRAVEKLRGFFTKRGVVIPAAVLTAAISANSVQAAPAGLAKTISAVAMTKGAAVSTTTLTLIKGALKTMAWSKLKLTTLVCAGILIAVGVTTQAVDHQYKHRHDALINKLGDDFVKDPIHVGLSIGIFDNGQESYYNFGATKRGDRSLPSENTIYEIGSITKSFLSLILANAVLEKKANLNDDIRRYLGADYQKLEYKGKGITLAELANGTSGLPNLLPGILDESRANRQDWYVAARRFEEMNRNDFFAALREVRLNVAPGSVSKHSNAAAQLLRYIIEDIYGVSIDQLIQKYISDPLKITNTSFSTSKERNAMMATGYDEQGNVTPYTGYYYDWGASGLDSCTADLVKFIRLQLDSTNEIVQFNHKTTFHAGNYDIALTWLEYQLKDGSHQLWCDGTTFGFSSYLIIYPEHNIGIILLANECDASTPGKLDNLADGIFREISRK
jgi:RNA polymerase sigma factor (sigma-70 family)